MFWTFPPLNRCRLKIAGEVADEGMEVVLYEDSRRLKDAGVM